MMSELYHMVQILVYFTAASWRRKPLFYFSSQNKNKQAKNPTKKVKLFLKNPSCVAVINAKVQKTSVKPKPNYVHITTKEGAGV